MNLEWNSLNIHSELKHIISDVLHFEKMTAVQAASIPLFINNKDLTVEAVTGSGKTLAFVLPILEILLKKSKTESIKQHDVGAIVISPTRELATQIHVVFRQFIDQMTSFRFKSMLLIGGSNPFKDIQTYMKHGAHIIVSTPGRLYDLLTKSENFSERVRKCLEVCVLDEADQLLSLGFEKTLNDILAYLPKLRRTSLFSATQTKELDQLIRAGLRNPVKIEIKEKNVNPTNVNRMVQMPNRLLNSFVKFNSCEEKIPFLIEFIHTQNCTGKYLIFMSTCAEVNYFEKILAKYLKQPTQITLLKLHRKLKNKRQKIFDQFRESQQCVLLCTDVMSRGVDIPQVDCVIHFDLPLNIESYIHRCGRSGHAVNTAGNSLLFTLPHEQEFVRLCRQKGIDIEERLTDTNQQKQSETILRWIKSELRRDINFYELSIEAFVSFIRTYSSKHFMAKSLYPQCDVVDIANAYGLLTLPTMPEMRQAKKCSTTFKCTKEDQKIVKHFKNILYAKKMKNKGIGSIDDDDDDDDGEAKTAAKHYALGFKRDPELQLRFERESKKLTGKKKRQLLDQLELEELANDARMVKKLKKGKISNKQFDKHFGL